MELAVSFAAIVSAFISVVSLIIVVLKFSFKQGVQTQKLEDVEKKVDLAHSRIDGIEDDCIERCGLAKQVNNNLEILIHDFQEFRKKVEINVFNIKS